MASRRGSFETNSNLNPEKSYSQILKASSIMGGAAGINMILVMVRVKFAAVLIGTTGVGLLVELNERNGCA